MTPLDKKPIVIIGKCKAIAIQILVHSGITKRIQNPIFRATVYPEPWHIQNQKHIQNPGILKTLVYSEPKAYSDIYNVKYLR